MTDYQRILNIKAMLPACLSGINLFRPGELTIAARAVRDGLSTKEAVDLILLERAKPVPTKRKRRTP